MTEERGVYYAPADCLGVWRRILIDVIDFLAISIAGIALSVFLPPLFLVVIWPGILITYFVFLKGTYRTLGYLIARARIVNLQGERPSYAALALRLIFAILGALFVATNYFTDVLWLSSDPARQALRDKCTRMYVIHQAAQPAGIGRIRYGVVTINGGALLYADVRRENLQP